MKTRNPWEFAGFLGDLPCDVMLEAKRKDLALLKLREDLDRLGLGGGDAATPADTA